MISRPAGDGVSAAEQGAGNGDGAGPGPPVQPPRQLYRLPSELSTMQCGEKYTRKYKHIQHLSKSILVDVRR